jgi:ATP-dependent RNA helicase RhlE
MSFDQFNLDNRIMSGIAKAGYIKPTAVQTAAIPVVLAGRDVIGTAQTGTGKTAAFVLPILQQILARPEKRTTALILTPTRELAEQIHETISSLSKGTRIKSATIYGGVNPMPQIQALRKGTDILVACPGRLLDHIEQRHADLSGLRWLVLDEADRMLDMGFMPSVRRILSHIPKQRQTLLFSATFPQEVESLAAQTLKDPERISVGLTRPAQTVKHALFPVAQHQKTSLLVQLLRRSDLDSVLIFTRTKMRAKRLAQQIERAGFKVAVMHSDRSQIQRQTALKGFKSGKFPIMVATDIAARGLDIENISHVINYDMPDTADAYIHRIGRTGRAERTGDAFTLITLDDEKLIERLEKIMGERIVREALPEFVYEKADASAGSSKGRSGRKGGMTSGSWRPAVRSSRSRR